jgi:hypothetical protein
MPLYTFIHILLNVLVQIVNKMGLQKNMAKSPGNIIPAMPASCSADHILLYLTGLATFRE